MTLVPLVTAALTASAGDLAERVSHVYEQHLVAAARAGAPAAHAPRRAGVGRRAGPPGCAGSRPAEARAPSSSSVHPGQPDTVWLLDTWEPAAGHVHYVHVTPGSDVTEVDIQLRPDGQDRSIASVRYTWTALGPPGIALVRSKTPEAYLRAMRHWETALNHYLTTGRMLPPEH